MRTFKVYQQWRSTKWTNLCHSLSRKHGFQTSYITITTYSLISLSPWNKALSQIQKYKNWLQILHLYFIFSFVKPWNSNKFRNYDWIYAIAGSSFILQSSLLHLYFFSTLKFQPIQKLWNTIDTDSCTGFKMNFFDTSRLFTCASLCILSKSKIMANSWNKIDINHTGFNIISFFFSLQLYLLSTKS